MNYYSSKNYRKYNIQVVYACLNRRIYFSILKRLKYVQFFNFNMIKYLLNIQFNFRVLTVQ